MDKFFKPVHGPCVPEEMKPRKHHHHHHRQDPQSHRYTLFEDTDRNTDEGHGHHRHHKHGHYLCNSRHHESQYHHQTQQFPQSEEDEILYNNHETPGALYRASSSSLSSSSSSSFSSFSSWYTEASANDPFAQRHAEQPQHSLSCSNIADVRRGFREDDGSEPIVFATIKHRNKSSVCSELQGISQKKGNHGFPSLDRGHSRSDEGLLQHNEGNLRNDRSKVHQINYGPLYKTASLNRSLAFSEEDILLGVSSGPKRAVSSSQLPSKGILKNKEPQPDIRKAKSMEVLSPRVSKGQDASGQKGKGNTQAEIEQARANFVQGKLQFSAFLDEITKQVMSPSDLTILGVKNNQVPGKMPAPVQTSTPVKPQLPPKKHRKRSGEEREQPLKHSAQEKATCSNPGKNSYPDKLVSYAAKNHHGSPPPHHYRHSTNHNSHRGRDHKDRKMSPAEGPQQSGDRCGRCGPHLTDGTSTSPEPTQPKQRHHRKQQTAASYNQHSIHYVPQQEPQQVHAGHPGGPGLGSESSSSKSDSSRTRDTGSTATSHSSEQSCRHQTQHVGQSKQRKEPICDDDHLQALQEENADLHQNLLQTVVCIESLEAELQRTRDELSHVKEKYKSLLETHSGTKQANSLLGEHLHIASESLSSERKYLQNRVLQLSSDLEDAHRTIAALENINVPCLIKELLEKHFDSAETIKNFLKIPAPNSPSATSVRADCQSFTPKMEELAHDKLMKSEAAPQRATAFSPFKQDVQVTGTESVLSDQREGSRSPPFTVEDISTAIYKKMAASYAARPQPHYPQSQQQPPLGTSHTDTPPNLQQAQVGGSTWSGKGRLEVTLLEEDMVDVTSTSAQHILDEFLKQLQPLKEPGGREQQSGQDWVGGAEHTGKVTD